ncbi:hypothetical protein So717_33630 [Roseobacter cerasinus]|uniref:AMP-dependent synthetase/ligase domain-containing protein n=1 Tax=Roseobacter cerasinus TaxID=2602289 RepID=A0A640VW39_9RHOB|nr:AMP-binding protein [Roseobacter cerasinus]GFE51610.1 hypothetical protein So717_33630 [Roseobacter cerasinus]
MQHSGFDAQKFNAMIGAYQAAGYPFDLAPVQSYEDFTATYAPSTKADLRKMSDALVAGGHLTGCYVVATSGSTEPPVIMGSRILHGATEDSYPYQARQLLEEHIFGSGDIAANLLTPGCFGQNYEGMSRVLEAVGATILPVGRMETMDDPATLLELLSTFGVNTLVGSPTGIIQLAHLAETRGVALPVRKVVFMGEAFHASKRSYLREVWPGCDIYSVYGASELGFVGVNTPTQAEREHIILSQWFFFEVDADGALLVTDLKSPMLPILRYRIGDRAQLVAHEAGPRLRLDGRCDSNFSLGGARVGVGQIRRRLETQGCLVDDLQITLSTDALGRDVLQLACTGLDAPFAARCESAVLGIPAIAAAVGRGVCSLHLTGAAERHHTARGKTPLLHDRRETHREMALQSTGTDA